MIQPPFLVPWRAIPDSLDASRDAPRLPGKDAGLLMSAINLQHVHSFVFELPSRPRGRIEKTVFGLFEARPPKESRLRWTGQLTLPCQLRSTRLPPLRENVSFFGARRGGLRPNHPTRNGDSSSSAHVHERSLTLPVVPRAGFAPKSSPFARNREPTPPPLPSSLRRVSIRSVFHHQGLARLGATPFRDAVTMIGEALLVCASQDVPAQR